MKERSQIMMLLASSSSVGIATRTPLISIGSMPSTASLTWRPRISATLCAIILQSPVAVLPPPARGPLDRVAVLSEPGSTRARHEPAIGATAETRLVGLRQSLVRYYV